MPPLMTLSTRARCCCSCSCGRASSSERSEIMMSFLPVSGLVRRRMVISAMNGLRVLSWERVHPLVSVRLAALARALRGRLLDLAVALLLAVALRGALLGLHRGE